MTQMRDGRDKVRLMGEAVHLWEEHSPKDIDNNPDYFDKMIHHITDINIGDPLSVCGQPFRVFLGSPNKNYCWADFIVRGIEKYQTEKGAPKSHLKWRRVSEWMVEDLSVEINKPKEPVVEPSDELKTEEPKRGPGRPRKVA